MPDKINNPTGVSLETEDEFERQLFDELASIPQRQPSERLRRSFYRRLNQAEAPRARYGDTRPGWFDWLLKPMVPALATLVIGLYIGAQLGNGSEDQGEQQIDLLRSEVATLNATVALSLLQKDSASDRLKGIDVATTMASGNPDITDALLYRAANDSSRSVRSAAISALGPQLADTSVANEVQRLMLDSKSPLVQLAFVELLMRWGDNDQLRNLVEAAETGRLLPDVQEYVMEKVRRMSA
jgi:hypothetical protein